MNALLRRVVVVLEGQCLHLPVLCSIVLVSQKEVFFPLHYVMKKMGYTLLQNVSFLVIVAHKSVWMWLISYRFVYSYAHSGGDISKLIKQNVEFAMLNPKAFFRTGILIRLIWIINICLQSRATQCWRRSHIKQELSWYIEFQTFCLLQKQFFGWNIHLTTNSSLL